MLVLLKHEVNKRGFFEGIWRWFVITLVTLIHRYSYSILLDTVVGYRKLRIFQQTRYHVSFVEFSIQNDWSQVAELVRRPRTMLKRLSVGPPIFLNIMLDKVSLFTGKKTYSFIGWGWIIWDREGKFNKFIDMKVAGALTQGVDTRDMSVLLVSLNFFGICVCFLRHNSGTSLLLWREGKLRQFSLKMRIFFDCFNRMKRKRESLPL